jgi:pyruvate carboxylase
MAPTEATTDDLYSHLMYPQVFSDFVKHRKAYSDVSVIPTPAFFYGLEDKEEITVTLEEGKTLFARLLNITDADPNGQRTAIFELNGYPRHVQVTDKSVTKTTVTKLKADPADAHQIGAPMPGMVASIAVAVGQKVKEGDALLTLEAMKMFTTVTAPADGTVQEIICAVGNTVESKDLMVRMGK